MLHPRFIPGRRAVVLAVLLCVAVPVSAFLQRSTVHFLASFNMPGAPNGSITAEIGQFNPTLPPPTFKVVPTTSGSRLEVSDTGAPVIAKLQGLFSKQFAGTALVVTWRMQALQTNSGLIFRVEDAGDQGILDCTWSGGVVTINGQPAGTIYDAGSTYDVTLRLSSSPLGLTTWQLELREGGMLISVTTGPLSLGAPLTVKSFDVIRAAGEPAGTFYVDEIIATSYDFLGK